MSSEVPIQLYFLTGFLGSGKTTLLNNLLDYLYQQKQKAGVVVNEWGQVGIDGSLINRQYMEIKELINGQIFCSCLAGNFVQALVTLGELPLKYVLVETSGLANPVTLKALLRDLKELTGDRYCYRGMLCLVDPVDFLTLSETVNAVEEQVINSQYILINKIDLVDETTLAKVEARVRELNSVAPIAKTSYAKIDGQIFNLNFTGNESEQKAVRHVTIPLKRPRHYLIYTEEVIIQEKIRQFAETVLIDAFRIKGFVRTEEGWLYLDGVNRTVSLCPVKIRGTETKVIVISKIGEALGSIIKSKWQEIVRVPAEIKEDIFNPPGKTG